jgi:hypothetical protein
LFDLARAKSPLLPSFGNEVELLVGVNYTKETKDKSTTDVKPLNTVTVESDKTNIFCEISLFFDSVSKTNFLCHDCEVKAKHLWSLSTGN